jgi:hypothetical protein
MTDPVDVHKSRWATRGLLAGLYLGACLLTFYAGHTMRILWGASQLLDRELLAEYPLQSLLLLHGQPPLLNLLLATILAAASSLGISPETLGFVLFLLFGAVAIFSLWELTLIATGSVPLAWAAAAITLVDPGFRHFQHMFFYTFLVAALLPLLLLCSARYLERGRSRDLAAVTACLVAIPLLRTLYPPLWALIFLALLLGLRRWRAGGIELRRAGAAIVTLAVLLAVWPLKNQIVFGEFVYSSWSGYNLARETPDGSQALRRFWVQRQIPPGAFERIERISERFGTDAIVAIAAPMKSDGTPNWNHAFFLETRSAMVWSGFDWRLRHPGAWGRTALEHYWMWSRATWVHPYFGAWFAPHVSAVDHGIDRILTSIFFPDLRPAIEWLLPPGQLDGFALVRDRKVPFTLFGLILFPGIVIAAVALLHRRLPRWSTGECVVALSLFCILWSLALPCLIEGVEGNRMRYTTSGLLTVVALYVIGHARHGLHRCSAR